MSDDHKYNNQEDDRRSKPKRKPQTTRVSFYGEIFDVPDDKDPDEVIERFVAAGKHSMLERVAPDVAVMLTERFIAHQQWIENGKKTK